MTIKRPDGQPCRPPISETAVEDYPQVRGSHEDIYHDCSFTKIVAIVKLQPHPVWPLHCFFPHFTSDHTDRTFMQEILASCLFIKKSCLFSCILWTYSLIHMRTFLLLSLVIYRINRIFFFSQQFKNSVALAFSFLWRRIPLSEIKDIA